MKLESLLERHAVDALVVAVTAAALSDADSAAGIAAALAPLPLLLRRRFPFAAPALVFALLAGASLADRGAAAGHEIFTVWSVCALALAFWFAGAHGEREQAIAGAAVGLASLTVVAGSAGAQFNIIDEASSDTGIGGWVLLGGGLALAAYALRRRAQRADEHEQRALRLEREREERTRAAVAAERDRIARDLHDLIAHSVSVMTVQAGAARLLLPATPERARQPLLAIEDTGRQALGEMRRLLGILRMHDCEATLAPQPGMTDLNALLERLRQPGLRIELTVEGGPKTLPPGIDLAAYRIVEDALANALEHAGPVYARVTVRYGRDALDLEIADDRTRAHASGNGLVALRERVAIYGGELEASGRSGGGYAVRAHLPLRAVR
jgi:signal transduction histidine kinase